MCMRSKRIILINTFSVNNQKKTSSWIGFQIIWDPNAAKLFILHKFYVELILYKFYCENNLVNLLIYWARPLEHINDLNKQNFLVLVPMRELRCFLTGIMVTQTLTQDTVAGNWYAHKWVHVKSVKSEWGDRTVSLSVFSCQVVLWFCKMLPLEETGWLIHRISFFYFLQLYVNLQSSEKFVLIS